MNPRKTLLRVSTGAAIAATLAIASRARAVEGFPRQIRSSLALSYEPPCGICHVKGNTGVGTAEMPFAISLRARGLQTDARSSLGTSLATARADGVDSDGDGVGDIDELVAGTDPNTPERTSIVGRADPSPGCIKHEERAGPAGPAAALGVIAFTTAWRRRKRRGMRRE